MIYSAICDSPTRKAPPDPNNAPKSEELTTRPDWKEPKLYLAAQQFFLCAAQNGITILNMQKDSSFCKKDVHVRIGIEVMV